MTKKDYELIASVLRYEIPDDDYSGINNWRMICHALATAFQLKNPNFNRSKFLKACGMEA